MSLNLLLYIYLIKFVTFLNFSRKCLKYKGNFQFLNFEY
nr:MAG TPA: hypothetical protein [Caudoviricetes sp.]